MINDAVCWNDLLQKFINEAQYVEWSAENGLMLKTIYGNLGRDDNGVIFFYSNGRPRLRSITLKDSKDGYEKTFSMVKIYYFLIFVILVIVVLSGKVNGSVSL